MLKDIHETTLLIKEKLKYSQKLSKSGKKSDGLEKNIDLLKDSLKTLEACKNSLLTKQNEDVFELHYKVEQTKLPLHSQYQAITRDQAEIQFSENPESKPIIRPASKGGLAITFRNGNTIEHAQIVAEEDGKYTYSTRNSNESTSLSIDQLIEQYDEHNAARQKQTSTIYSKFI